MRYVVLDVSDWYGTKDIFIVLQDESGGCVTMQERYEGVESPGAYENNWAFKAAIFACPVFFGLPSHALVDYHLERGLMPLQDAVGVNCKKKAQHKNQIAGARHMG